MGTETVESFRNNYQIDILSVKLNNPLMGTETEKFQDNSCFYTSFVS